MAHTVISAKYPPHLDPSRTPLAFEHRAVPRLNKELNDANLLVKQQAVMALCDYLHDPEHIVEALREGIGESLRKLLTNKDITVRQKATECLYVIGGHAIGRYAFLDHALILPIAALFNDRANIARKNAHKALEMLSETPPGADGIVSAGLVQILVEKLSKEVDEIKELILDTLHFCMRIDTEQALMSGAMEIFTELLKHKTHSIKAKAARNIIDLSVSLDGKDKAVEVGTVEQLVGLLNDSSTNVRANVSGALMTITITTKGKCTAIEANAIPALMNLVDDSISEVRLNALKALTCLSETPEGRVTVSEYVEKIKSRIEDEIPSVSQAARTAVGVVTWKP